MNDPKTNQRPTTVDARTERDIRTVADNLRDLHARADRILACDHIQAQALAQLYARAYVPHSATVSADDALPSSLITLWEQVAATYTDSAFAPNNLKQSTAAALRQMSNAEQICLCRSFISALADRPDVDLSELASALLGTTEPVDSTARGTIIYQHNIYADEAFLLFSRVLPSARASYADSFSGVCEQVFDGRCEYCILPLENTQDGKLVRFYGLIEKYELKVVLTCKVTTSDNRHSTVFGLCRRGISLPQPPVRDRNVCFEFIFWQEHEHMTLAKLLSAAEACSLSLLRADCLPRSDEEILMGAGYPFDVCLEIAPNMSGEQIPHQHEFLAFLLYLSIHSPTYLPLGIYQQL
ncbi:MAG: hypothetical protein J6R04_07420 [Clostridia bacterium]|nr:hypothetical protein [Clostridia bacterium]